MALWLRLIRLLQILGRKLSKGPATNMCVVEIVQIDAETIFAPLDFPGEALAFPDALEFANVNRL